jgi:hypothetical protein
MSKRIDRMLKWIEANPYQVYGDRNDELSDDQAAMILAGNFTDFDESWCEVEWSAGDYADWSDWESNFADEFGLEDWDSVSEHIKQLCLENRFLDCSDLLRTCCRNWTGHVCARLKDSRGNYIEFPSSYDHDDNATRARYLSIYCGIKGDPECAYDGTYLTALGRVDLWQIYSEQAKPEYVKLIKGQCFTIGHEPMNGSGTCANDQFMSDKPRVFAAEFFVDGKRGYGVQDIYGFVGESWSNDLHHMTAQDFLNLGVTQKVTIPADHATLSP